MKQSVADRTRKGAFHFCSPDVVRCRLLLLVVPPLLLASTEGSWTRSTTKTYIVQAFIVWLRVNLLRQWRPTHIVISGRLDESFRVRHSLLQSCAGWDTGLNSTRERGTAWSNGRALFYVSGSSCVQRLRSMELNFTLWTLSTTYEPYTNYETWPTQHEHRSVETPIQFFAVCGPKFAW